MENITRRGFIGLAGLTGAALMAGCTQQPAESKKAEEKATDAPKQEEKPKEPEQEKTANIDEEVSATTKYGDIKITVKGFETSDDIRERYTGEYSTDKVSDTQTVGALLMLLENVSYKDQYNPDDIDLQQAMTVKDADGISLSPLNSAADYGQYEAAAGAFLSCKVGEKKRAAVYYIVEKSMETATVMIGKTKVACPVTCK